MSRTDKTDPLWVKRTSEATWHEKGSGPKGVRMAKREARRASRRGRSEPYVLKSLTQTYTYNSG